MSLRPEDWNVVVLGRWNAALFTPAAISKRIFGLAEGIPVEVFVVLDDIQLPRVRHDGLVVSPSVAQLIISPEKCSFAELDRARLKASEAISSLPQTPISGAGCNFRYRSESLPESLLSRFSSEIDQRFSDNEFHIVARDFQRALEFHGGRVNIRVTQDPAELLLNFDFQSKDAEAIKAWLNIPIADIKEVAERIVHSALELGEDDYVIERNDHTGQH